MFGVVTDPAVLPSSYTGVMAAPDGEEMPTDISCSQLSGGTEGVDIILEMGMVATILVVDMVATILVVDMVVTILVVAVGMVVTILVVAVDMVVTILVMAVDMVDTILAEATEVAILLMTMTHKSTKMIRPTSMKDKLPGNSKREKHVLCERLLFFLYLYSKPRHYFVVT